MKQYLSIFTIILLWIISFVEPSGWAIMYHLPEKVNMSITIIALICFIVYPNRRLPISRSFVLLLIVFLAIIPYMKSSTWQGASYMVAFLTTYVVSLCKITPKVIKYTSWAVALLGLFILYIYLHGSILSGWNDNAMAMTGLFSYLFFSIFLIFKRGTRSFWFWNIVTIVYLQLLFQTDCRSGMLFAIIAVLAIYYSNQTRKIIDSKNLRLFMLNIPLIISLIVIIVVASYFEELNQWSIQNFDKTIFNGRDILWKDAYELLEKSDYIGTGQFMLNYHNSGVAAITVFGLIGYVCWIKFFSFNLSKLNRYLSDDIVFGSILAFLLIFLQQSVELGFIGEYPNLLPYTILGIGWGRVNVLKQL